MFSMLPPENQPILQVALIPFTGEWYLEPNLGARSAHYYYGIIATESS